MKKYLCITLLISLQLACGVASTLPTQPEVFTQTATVTETAQSVNMESAQIVGSWNFRTQPGESSPLISTLTDVEVTLYDCLPYEDGGQWCEIQSGGVTGWVNGKGIK